jgi:hypothetical protein
MIRGRAIPIARVAAGPRPTRALEVRFRGGAEMDGQVIPSLRFTSLISMVERMALTVKYSTRPAGML